MRVRGRKVSDNLLKTDKFRCMLVVLADIPKRQSPSVLEASVHGGGLQTSAKL